jgi:murein DD-endopeptidase MepM/ murein hydrolase activator NlpD
MDQANYVVIDHGDGTYGEYYHLRQFGVLVEEGEHVCAGDVVAICGNTGYSTGPHLHFAVTDLTRRTVPFQFRESRVQRDYGFPVPDSRLVSMNQRRSRCPDDGYSSFGEDAFAHQGVVLDEGFSTVITERGKRRISGTFYGDHPRIALHRKSTRGGAWLDQCVEVDDDGEFEFEVEWPMDRFSPGTYWLMITGASDDCLAPGWAWSYKARVR